MAKPTKSVKAFAYLKTSSAANIGEDKDSGRRQLEDSFRARECLLFYWDSDIGRSVPELDLEKPVSIISTDEGVRQSGRRIRARARELQF